jgi:predicted phage terminase large subunit-like protein
MTDPNELRRQLRKRVDACARKNLFDYTQLMFPEVVPSGTFIEASHTKLLAHKVEQVVRGDIKRLLIAIPPRFGKSLLCSVALPTWMLGHDPSYKIVCASYGDELSRDFATLSRNILQSRRYQELFPGTRLTHGGGAIGRLETTAGGYRFSTSIGGALTGKGADIVIVDDPLKAKDAITSQVARDDAFSWITGTVMSRFDSPADGAVIVLSQRLHTDDLIARLRDEGGWELLAVPAEALTPMTFDIGEAEPWHLEAGEPLFPERFGPDALAQLRSDLGEANYAAQILQDPRALGGSIFKVKDFKIQDCRRFDLAKMEAIYQSWDTASSEAATAAWSVCTTWGISGKRFALIDVFRQRLTYPKLLIAVKEQYERYKPKVVFVEKASSGIALLQQLAAEGVTWIDALTPRGTKLERAMHQAPKIENGRVCIPGKAAWAPTFLAEVASFPSTSSSDQVDAMTQFLQVFDTARHHPFFRELEFWRNQRGEP